MTPGDGGAYSRRQQRPKTFLPPNRTTTTGESRVHALGLNAGVMFLVSGLFGGEGTRGPHIDARFSATYADGSVLQGTFSLAPVSSEPRD